MKKCFDEAKVGEEFAHNNFIYLKLSELSDKKPYWVDCVALVLDNRLEPKEDKNVH